MSFELSLSRLPTDHIDALHEVDLQLWFAHHGVANHHPSIGNFTDIDRNGYEALDPLSEAMDAQRGDVLAVEYEGYTEPVLDPEHFKNLVYDSISYSEIARPVPRSDFKAVLSEARRVQVIDAFANVTGHAVLKSVPVHMADATNDQLDAWDGAVEDLSLWERLCIRNVELDLKLTYRDMQRVRRYGEIATTMAQNAGLERPVLYGLTGRDHNGKVAQLLRQNNVPFTVTRVGGLLPRYIPGLEIAERRAHRLQALGAHIIGQSPRHKLAHMARSQDT